MFIFKNYTMLRVTLTLTLVISFLSITVSTPSPVSAGVLQWTMVDTPGNNSNIIVSPSSEVNSIAVGIDGVTCYAVDTPRGKIYKSTNGGYTWNDITSPLIASGAVMPAWSIAVASDNPNIVAVITGLPSSMNIFASIDGGSNWQDTNFPPGNKINALDISPNYKNYDIIAGTRTGAGVGKAYIYRLPGFGGWIDQGFTGDILAAKFSPNYASDSSLVVVFTNAAGTYANFGVRDIAANTTNWASWPPIELTLSGAGTSPKTSQIKTADLELPSDFMGQVGSQRHIYISINDSGTTGNAGIYRIDDNIIYRIMPATGTKMISSIAFAGPNNSGKLLAGEAKANASLATVDVWFSPNPGASCPQSSCIIWQKAVKPPTGGASSGNANAQVAWGRAGAVAYCGTSSANLDTSGWPNGYLTSVSLDESAFSMSQDNGRSWNQLSLIDTSVNFLSDVVATANSDTLYIASINTNDGLKGFDSIWRSTSQPMGLLWERVLCMLANSNDVILSLSPSQANQSVFTGIRNTSELYQSDDKGQIWNTALPGVNITDFAVSEIRGITTMFVLENSSVRKGEYNNQMWKWGLKTGTSLNSGHAITATPSGLVVVGDAGEGMVAFSPDSGAQFIRLPPVPSPGNIHAIVDTRIGSNIVIYAGSDASAGQLYSWVYGSVSDWITMSAPGQSCYGLDQAGTLYGIWSNSASSGVNRTLNPEALRTPFIEWSNLRAGLSNGVLFTREPKALKISGGIDLWALDNRPYTGNTGRLWHYCDCLSPAPPSIIPQRSSQQYLFQAPVLTSPASNSVIPVDSITGEISDIEFEWQHPSLPIGYDLWIAKDKELTQTVIKQSMNLRTPSFTKWTLSSPDKSALEFGSNYYWRVRVNRNDYYEKGDGQWSTPMLFSTAAKPAPQPPQPTSPTPLSPINNAVDVNMSPRFSWAPVPGVAEYEFTLARDQNLQQLIINRTTSEIFFDYNGKLDPGNTYFWQVRTTKPFISQPSQILSFTIVVKDSDAPQATNPLTTIPLWLWIIAAFLLVAILVAVLVVIRTRQHI
jgi:hypothetical protein